MLSLKSSVSIINILVFYMILRVSMIPIEVAILGNLVKSWLKVLYIEIERECKTTLTYINFDSFCSIKNSFLF